MDITELEQLFDLLYAKFGKRDRSEICAREIEEIERHTEKFEREGDKERSSLVLHLTDEYSRMVSNMSAANFKCGVIFGARLIFEMYSEFLDNFDVSL